MILKPSVAEILEAVFRSEAGAEIRRIHLLAMGVMLCRRIL
jgi:hypothetical protein